MPSSSIQQMKNGAHEWPIGRRPLPGSHPSPHGPHFCHPCPALHFPARSARGDGRSDSSRHRGAQPRAKHGKRHGTKLRARGKKRRVGQNQAPSRPHPLAPIAYAPSPRDAAAAAARVEGATAAFSGFCCIVASPIGGSRSSSSDGVV